MAERDDLNDTDQQWADLLADEPSSTGSVEDAVRYIHSLYAAPPPGSARERARQRVFDSSHSPKENTMSAIPISIAPPSPNGHKPAVALPPIHNRAARSIPKWALLSLAALVLIAGVGASTFFWNVPPVDRLFGGEESPSLIPAAQPPFDDTSVELLWETNGPPTHPLASPQGVALAPDGNVYVVNVRGMIDVYSPDGDFLESFGERGSGPGEFNFVAPGFALGNLEFDAEGNLYVFDTGNDRVQKFGPDHGFIREWGTSGSENPGEFDLTMGTVDDKQNVVYVIDRTGRVQVFDLDGNFLRQWGSAGTGPGEFTDPWDIAIDAQGNLFVTDLGVQDADARVQRFDPSGEIVTGSGMEGSDFFTFPGIAFFIEVGPDGNLYLAQFSGDTILIISPDGSLIGTLPSDSATESWFNGPTGMAFDGQGHFYVADQYGGTLKKFALSAGG